MAIPTPNASSAATAASPELGCGCGGGGAYTTCGSYVGTYTTCGFAGWMTMVCMLPELCVVTVCCSFVLSVPADWAFVRSRCTDAMTFFGSLRYAVPSSFVQSMLSDMVLTTCGNSASD